MVVPDEWHGSLASKERKDEQMKKGSQYLIGAVIIAGVVDLFMANRVYLKKKGVVLRDMVLTSLDETARGRGRSRRKDTRQDEQNAQQSIWQDEQDIQQNIWQDEQGAQQNIQQDEQDAQQSTQQDEQGAQQNIQQDEQDAQQSTQQDEQDTQQNIWQDEQGAQQDEQNTQRNITPDPADGKAARNSGRIVIE